MRIFGLVAEFNPLHKGHEYIINNIKNTYPESKIIIVLSGSFVQRGEPSILSKWDRATLALRAGADLVLELPAVFSCQNAEVFSKGALKILNGVGITDLAFGSEIADKERFIKISNSLNIKDENLESLIKSNLNLGNSYIRSRNMALESLNILDKDEINFIEKPNNILGIEYTKAILENNYNININPIYRINSTHDDISEVENFTSSTNIRNKLYNNKEFNHLIPDIYKDISFDNLPDKNLLYEFIKYKFLIDKIDYKNILDYEKGLENRIIKYLDSEDLDTFYENVSNKRITTSRVRRFIISSLLEIEKEDIFRALNKDPYIRILGFNNNGASILKNLENPYINKFSEYYKMSDNIKNIAKIEIKATNLYSLLKKENINQDYLKSPIIIK